MEKGMLVIMAWIAGAGAVGGVVNAFMSDNGFFLPVSTTTERGTMWQPGYLGNILVSTVAALVSWGLYGPAANAVLVVSPPVSVPDGAKVISVSLSLANLMGALMVGVAGARWLSNEVDKTMLRLAITKVAAAPADASKASLLAQASPSKAVQIAEQVFESAPAPVESKVDELALELAAGQSSAESMLTELASKLKSK
ncbi:hypothetical protein [Hymenobacter negativus]|nr:hypothetical protein [Hymenobacter negativus]